MKLDGDKTLLGQALSLLSVSLKHGPSSGPMLDHNTLESPHQTVNQHTVCFLCQENLANKKTSAELNNMIRESGTQVPHQQQWLEQDRG